MRTKRLTLQQRKEIFAALVTVASVPCVALFRFFERSAAKVRGGCRLGSRVQS